MKAERRLAALSLLLLIGPVEAAGVYKWTDADNRVHYDDRRVQEQRLTLGYLNQRQVAAQSEATTPREFVTLVAQDCRNTRDRATAFREASTLYGSDPAGNVYPLSARQRALEVAAAAQEADRYCRAGAAEQLYREHLASLRAESKVVRIAVDQR